MQKIDTKKKAIIDEIIAQIESKFSADKAALISEFTRQFYNIVAFEDLTEHSLIDLYGAAVSFWDLIEYRQDKETKVRVYNPDFEQHGWQSTHTIIEVVQDDMPFLVDSIRMEIDRLGITSHLIIHLGGMQVSRDASGRLTQLYPLSSKQTTTPNEVIVEAPIYFEISRQTDPNVLATIQDNLERILHDVRICVEDWSAMRKRVRDVINDLAQVKNQLDKADFHESMDFLHWIEDHHFTFLGVRDYELTGSGSDLVLKVIPNTGLGVLHDASTSKVSRSISSMTPEAQHLTLSNQILILSKTNTRSTVHRPIYTDYIGIKRFDNNGKVIGERRLIGLFTSAAYNTNPKHIPFLRRKVGLIIAQANVNPKSHTGKVLLNILDTLPRDDLFQASIDELAEIAMGIFHLQERRRIRMFVRQDVYGRFISCLVYVPRERFNTELQQEMEKILSDAFHAIEINFSIRFSDSVLARIHFVIRIDPKTKYQYDIKSIEKKLIEIGRIWKDELYDNLLDFFGEEQGNQLATLYLDAFHSNYRETFPSLTAIYDIKHIEQLRTPDALEMNFYRRVGETHERLHFKVIRLEWTVPLSDVLPILENMGLRVISEQPYEVNLQDGRCAWINDFGMVYCKGLDFEIESIKDKFQDAFSNIWCKRADNDSFNRLVLAAGLSWREITVLRAYARYLRQVGFTFSQAYIEEAMFNNASIAKELLDLFNLKFATDKTKKDRKALPKLEAKLLQSMDAVASLDEDRILRRFYETIRATLRTNYFQQDKQGLMKSYLSFKLNPQAIPELPLPLPKYEISVYSPEFEGVHLRAGKVARGGLRWSDRPEDFRTEILGLMKAQNVKNAVIVPNGAKGGFVPKNLPIEGGREETMEVAIGCYKDFIRGLLDITDNLTQNKVVPPRETVRYDDDDPYLVVAADKGTATFSDLANEISAEYNYWLGDAFASGGSTGYDHKKMGITARGAWESVKRHFRELNIDIQTTNFSVVGIGDMAGDVFGNGVLLSEHIELVGAFNHLHIFIDPKPDSKTSFQERRRLFKMTRSSWSDYNPKLISKGGGIYKRSEKVIKVTPEVKKLLGITADEMEPNQLIRAMLKAPVDLLWNGGIGTFVKAENELNTDVGDRSNDAIRINATELNCKVIGEGGNLGITQLGRIEFSLHGGLVYTDFIDNSAGVDCSDHEVNLKILLNEIVASGDMTYKQRNELLVKMTADVIKLVLYNNYRQTQAISFAADQAAANIELHSLYIEELERVANLDRKLEFLPEEKVLKERKLAGKGITRPALAIIMSYSKSNLKQMILASDVPEDPYVTSFLRSAFPKIIQKKYTEQLEQHRLKREIIAMQLSNTIINQMGFSFTFRLYDETGSTTAAIVRAFIVIQNVFSLDKLWQEIEACDNKVSVIIQHKMMLQLVRLIRRATRWILRNRRQHFDILATIKEFLPGIGALDREVDKLLTGDSKRQYNSVVKQYVTEHIPVALAEKIAKMRSMAAALDIIEGANENNVDIVEMARIYYAIGHSLELDWVRSQVLLHPVETHWDALSRQALRDDLDWQQRLLTINIISNTDAKLDADTRINQWLKDYKVLIQRWRYLLTDIRSNSNVTFIMFFVAIRELLDLTQTSLQACIVQDHSIDAKV